MTDEVEGVIHGRFHASLGAFTLEVARALTFTSLLNLIDLYLQ